MKTKNYRQLRQSCLLIILSLIILFILIGCINKKDIATQAECLKQEGYWYNEMCWDDFTPTDDAFIAKEDIEQVIEDSLKTFERTGRVIINENSYPLESFILEEVGDGINLTVSLLKDDNEKYISMIQLIGGLPFDTDSTDIDTSEIRGTVILLRGNIHDEEYGKELEPLNQLQGIIESIADKDTEKFKNYPIIMGFGALSATPPEKEAIEVILSGSFSSPNNTQQYVLTSYINDTLVGWGSSTITVQEDEAFIDGTLGTVTYIQMKNLIENNPQVKTVVLGTIDGSINDSVNVHTGRILREAGLNTKVLSSSAIYSGGVDLFSAGVERIYEDGAKIGVHSWCCVGDKTARELSKLHPGHRAQLEYFSMALGEKAGPDFYFYTLEAAPFDDVYEMTKDELKKTNLVTQFI